MSAFPRALGPTILVGTLLAAGVPAAAQSPAPSIAASPAPAGSASPSTPAVPADLVSGTDPAWSMVLDYNWGVVEGDDLVNAQGASASTLALRNESLPAGATFEEDVDLVLARLQKAAGKKTDLELTFRRTGIGTVARVTYPSVKEGDRAVFLFPACTDGMRVLDIIGFPWVSPTDGGPDWWDAMAATVNPCSADPVPPLVLAPEVAELATHFASLATASNEAIDTVAKPIINGAGVKVWNRTMKRIRQLRTEVRDEVTALPWTPELQPLVDTWANATTAIIESELSFVTATKPTQLEAALVPWRERLAAGRAAAAELRLAIGLATLPR